ncbi:MAG: hypothetical protein G01um10147_232 [Microgenomates group bacterium Gr01-1014_7]|nr:MAG: hypothetical protein G01um10147_232 [Microgenomates group bacterium Gr01-1014_7]
MASLKKVTSSKFPYLPIQITVRENSYQVEALLDTGFDGSIVLPQKLFSNGESPTKYVDCKLADNSVIEVPIYIGFVKLANRKLNDIAILIMGDEPIIGRGVMNNFKITLDHGKKIILE